MDDLKSVIIKQINFTKYEEEKRKEEAKKQAEAEEKRTAAEERIKIKEFKKIFNYQKEKIEGSCIREVLEIIVEVLNSSDEKFSPLKQKVVKKILNNPHSSIKDFNPFIISQPYLFKGNSNYQIDVYFYDQYNLHGSLFNIYFDNREYLRIRTNLFQHNGSRNLPLNKELAAAEIVDFLMTV